MATSWSQVMSTDAVNVSTDYQSHHNYPMPDPECYVYFHHTGDYIILPSYPDSVNDAVSAQFSPSTPLGRSAPLHSYTGSGPRSLQFSFTLHRDEMWQLNKNNASMASQLVSGDDYVDIMAKKIQGSCLPEYALSEKMVSPPMLSMKVGTEIFIKGVVNGSVGVTYEMPILRSGKYACIKITFTVTEITPFSATQAMELGSYRNVDYDLANSDIYVAGYGENYYPGTPGHNGSEARY